MKPYEFVQVEQDSPEWHELRSVSVGSSDAPAIAGVSKWDTARSIYRTKKGITLPKFQSFSMKFGKEKEEEIRHQFNFKYETFVVPCVLKSLLYPGLIASLDGFSFDEKVVIEIKCANKEDHETAKSGKVPIHYFPQVQHALIVTGLNTLYYVSYHNEELIVVEVFRDEDYIQQLLLKELDFLECLNNDIEPALEESEHLDIEADLDQILVIQEHKDTVYQMKQLEKKRDYLKQEILSWGDDGNICFLDPQGKHICKITRVMRKSDINWEKLCKDKNISPEELEAYRSEKHNFYWKVS